jgi:diguanylate cyclase (GGDEF)-like protein
VGWPDGLRTALLRLEGRVEKVLMRARDAVAARDAVQGAAATRVLLLGGDESDLVRVRGDLAASRCTPYEVQHAPRLASAQDLLQAKELDVILLVLATSGPDLLAPLLSARLRAPEVPIVVLSELDDETLAHKALQSGARGYLTKVEANPRLLATTIGVALGSQRTIRQLNVARERARDLATCDQLTGLANRLLFNDRLFQAVASARRSRQTLAVIFLDLDGFKMINDSLGHAVGDGFLRGIAQRLMACLRETDTAARLGGDEFAVLLTQLTSELDAAEVAQKILESIRIPMVLRHRSFVTTASIGIATFPRDGLEPEDLVKKADTAMYQAKKRGRNRYEFFTEDMNAAIVRRAALETRLRTALEHGGLALHYQPQFDLRRGRIVGAEALVRWEHPELGLLMPAEFLPAAEDAGLMIAIGEWVLRAACRESAAWQDAHPGFRVSVNVATQQFQEPGFVALVREALAESGLRPDCLELEITESTLVQDVEVMVNTLHALKQVGVSLSIDDFGTGYSALAYLKNLPIDALKIDQSFVRALTTDPADATLTQTIVRMAQGLNLVTVAEGVETPEQLLLLGSYGCHRMQGFLFGRPMPAQDLLRSISEPTFQWMRGVSWLQPASGNQGLPD